jgi:hypothetical protein
MQQAWEETALPQPPRHVPSNYALQAQVEPAPMEYAAQQQQQQQQQHYQPSHTSHPADVRNPSVVESAALGSHPHSSAALLPLVSVSDVYGGG